MTKHPALMALAFMMAVSPLAAISLTDKITGRDRVQGEETTGDFRHWADGKLHGLRKDFDRFDKRLDSYGNPTQESYKDKVGELEQRVSKDEGRLQEVGDHNDRTAWKTRKEIRDDIKDIRQDFLGLRRKLDRK